MTENTNITPFENRCEILGDLWITYKNDESLLDFVEYADLALPFAYALARGIVDYSASDKMKPFIDEAWDLFLASLGVEDKNYETLDQLFEIY
jgi:hypothetical protein